MVVKKAKAEVDYSPGRAKGDHCGICVHFQPRTRSCEKVAGIITSGMWCRLFERNASVRK